MIDTQKITLLETGLRDGLQAVKNYVSIEDRILLANGLIDAGIKSIQITSFVNPKKVPQMSEAEDLISRLSPNIKIEYSALVFNRKGVERAINSGIILIPPSKVKTVGDNCFRDGYSNDKDTPNKRKANKGKTININKDIVKVGICFPNCSLCFVA